MSSLESLWLTFFVSIVLVLISQSRSRYIRDGLGEIKNIFRDKTIFIIATIIMSFFIGLRIWCNDTGTYRDIYEYLTSATGNVFGGISWKIGDSPGFLVMNSILKHCGLSTQSYLMFYAFITVGIYMWFIYRHSMDLSISVFLFWTMGVYTFAAAGMRQAAAIAIGLIGIDYFLRNKKIGFVFWILVAVLFHPYTICFLLAPLMTYSPWKKKTYWMICICGGVGIFLGQFIGLILNVTNMMGKQYNEADFTGEGVNIFRLLVVWAPIVLSFLLRKFMKKSNDKRNNLFMNFSILNACIMFVALFGTANYFARLANYFLIFQTLSVPWIISFFDEKNRKFMKVVIVCCYLLYFFFANVILTPFNSYFAKMSIWEYLSSIL